MQYEREDGDDTVGPGWAGYPDISIHYQDTARNGARPQNKQPIASTIPSAISVEEKESIPYQAGNQTARAF